MEGDRGKDGSFEVAIARA